jgi:AcrR family transcriptional regulator
VPDRAQRRREEILRAAERVFATKGYHATGIADIAAILGIGHGTFYRYFKNKHDIATSVLEHVVARMAEPGLSEDPEAANDLATYRGQTERILSQMLQLAEEHPNLVRFFHEQSVSVDRVRTAAVLDTYAAHTALFLRNGIDKGFLRAELDVQSTAEALVALILEGTRRAVMPDRTAADRRRWVDAGISLMFDGIRAAQ